MAGVSVGESRPRMKPRTFGEWTMCGWESRRGGGGCPCGGVVGFGGRVRGGKPSTNETTMRNGRCTNGSGFDRVYPTGTMSTSSTTCLTQRLRAGEGCPCGGLWVSAGAAVGESRPRMKSTMSNERCANVSRFGMGEAVPATGCGFRRARLWGGSTNFVTPPKYGGAGGLTDGNGRMARGWKLGAVNLV